MLLILILSQFIWAQDPQLQGVWGQSCLNQASRQENFSDTTVTLTESYFADKSCAHRHLAFSSSGAFTASAGIIDFAFSQISITLHDALYVKDFNQRKVCAIDHWQLGKVQDVTGKFCELFGPGIGLQIPPSGQMRYGIYKIEKDRLYFGRLSTEYDSSHPTKRPKEFDGRYFTRQ